MGQGEARSKRRNAMSKRSLFFRIMNIFLTPATVLAVAILASCGVEVPDIMRGLGEGTYAWFETNKGEFVCRLFVDKAPLTAANFIGLAEGTKPFTNPRTKKKEKRPFYDGLKIHGVVRGIIIQGGDPLGTGKGGPGYTFPDEFNRALRHNKPGILSMASYGPNTNGSQFIITLSAQPKLDDKHTVFGEVVRGMNVIKVINDIPVNILGMGALVEQVLMTKVRIYRIGPKGKPIAK